MATAQSVTRKWPARTRTPRRALRTMRSAVHADAAPTAADPAMPARGSGTRLARAQRNAGP